MPQHVSNSEHSGHVSQSSAHCSPLLAGAAHLTHQKGLSSKTANLTDMLIILLFSKTVGFRHSWEWCKSSSQPNGMSIPTEIPQYSILTFSVSLTKINFYEGSRRRRISQEPSSSKAWLFRTIFFLSRLQHF